MKALVFDRIGDPNDLLAVRELPDLDTDMFNRKE